MSHHLTNEVYILEKRRNTTLLAIQPYKSVFLFLKYKGIEQTKIKQLEPNISLQNQANLELFVKSCIWYRQRESNPRSSR